jgi:hypothetical protein
MHVVPVRGGGVASLIPATLDPGLNGTPDGRNEPGETGRRKRLD